MSEFFIGDRDPVDCNRQQGYDQYRMPTCGPFPNQRPDEHREGAGQQSRPDQSELAENAQVDIMRIPEGRGARRTERVGRDRPKLGWRLHPRWVPP